MEIRVKTVIFRKHLFYYFMNWFSSSSHDKHQARGQSWFCTMQMETNPTSLFGNARVLHSVKKPLGKHYQQKRRLLCSAPGYLYKLFSADALVTTLTFLSLKVKALHKVWLPHGTSYCQTCHKDCVFIKNAAISSVKCTRFPRNNGDTTRHYFVFIFFSPKFFHEKIHWNCIFLNNFKEKFPWSKKFSKYKVKL